MEEVSREAITEVPAQAACSRVPVRKTHLAHRSVINNYHPCTVLLSTIITTVWCSWPHPTQSMLCFKRVSQGFSSQTPRSFPTSTWSRRRERAVLTRGPWTMPTEFMDSPQTRRLTSRAATASRGATEEARGTKWKKQERWSNGTIWWMKTTTRRKIPLKSQWDRRKSDSWTDSKIAGWCIYPSRLSFVTVWNAWSLFILVQCEFIFGLCCWCGFTENTIMYTSCLQWRREFILAYVLNSINTYSTSKSNM